MGLKVTPANIASRRETAKVLRMRALGMTYRDIAEKLGKSVGYIHLKARRAMSEVTLEDAEAALNLENTRLDKALLTASTIAYGKASSTKEKLAALDRIHRNVELRVDLMNLRVKDKGGVSNSDGPPPINIFLADGSKLEPTPPSSQITDGAPAAEPSSENPTQLPPPDPDAAPSTPEAK